MRHIVSVRNILGLMASRTEYVGLAVNGSSSCNEFARLFDVSRSVSALLSLDKNAALTDEHHVHINLRKNIDVIELS